MSALQTLLVTVGVFLLACGMARPQAQPATSSAHARVEWQSRKIVTLRDCHSTRACAEEVAGCAWGRAMPQASRKTPTVTRRVCNADMGASRFTFLGGRRDPCHPTLASL